MKKLILLVLVIPMIANAGLYVEPYLGYEVGEGEKINTATPSANKYDITGGSTTGIRAGYTFLGVMAGYEYSTGSNKLDVTGGKEDVDTTLHGLYAGYYFPSVIPFLGKVWATYNFGGDMELDNIDYDLDSGYAVGVSLAPIPIPLPFVSLHLNFEMRNNTYETGTREVEAKTYLVSVGVPINI